MKIKPARVVAILLASILGETAVHRQAGAQAPAPSDPPAAVAPQYTVEEEAEARVALAERFSDIALSAARSLRYSRVGLQQACVFLDAAVLMNPAEPRFLRQLAMFRERLGEPDAAIAAWVKYRAVVPDDNVAQVALIDLYLTRQQGNDAKIKYINELLDNPKLDDQVKAHTAAKGVYLLDQRSRPAALEMLARARKFYPLPEVARLEWAMLPAGATKIQQFDALLNILRANPTDVEAMALVADQLAANGLSEQALTMYSGVREAYEDNGTSASPATILNYLAERYRAGETTVANEELDKWLQRYPDIEEVWELRLTTQRGEESASMIRDARDMFSRHVSMLCEFIMKQPLTPGTAPVAVPNPAPASTEPSNEQLTAAVARLKQLNNPQFIDAFVDKLGNAAWFEIYFDHKPEAAAPLIAALKQVRPADDFLVTRLDGWYAFATGNEAAARAIFTARQAADPLCMLGLFALEDSKNHTAAANIVGAKIMADPRLGVVAAMLYQATKGHGIKSQTQPPDAAAMKTALDQFPKDWLDVIHAPGRFYSVRVEPLKIGHRLGEPMLANITIQNESKMDICVGDQGLIKSWLQFDGAIRGINAQVFPRVAVDRVMGRLVLHPGEIIGQIVRIDQAELSQAMRSKPAVLLLLQADVITNGRIDTPAPIPTAGGYARNFGKMFTRNAFPLAMNAADNARRKLFDNLANGTPASKILDIELLAAYYRQYVQPKATDAELTFAQQYVNFIDKSRSDPAPGIKVWASYTFADLVTGDAQRQALVEMMQSNSWEIRLLALRVAGEKLPFDVGMKFATAAAATDKDPLVKAYANGLLELARSAAATQPANRSATEPSVAPTPSTRPANIAPAVAPAPVTAPPAAAPPARPATPAPSTTPSK